MASIQSSDMIHRKNRGAKNPDLDQPIGQNSVSVEYFNLTDLRYLKFEIWTET